MAFLKHSLSRQNSCHFISSLTLIVFFLFAAGCSSMNKMKIKSFDIENHPENVVSEPYVLKNDGTRIYGKTTRFAKKNEPGYVYVDEVGIPRSQIAGYVMGQRFFLRKGPDYILRIVSGKLNVYYQLDGQTFMTSDANGNISSRHRWITKIFVQKDGEMGPLFQIKGQKDIKEWVKDCPAAVEMCSKSNSEIRRAIRKNKHYLNSIFELYNKDCKQP